MIRTDAKCRNCGWSGNVQIQGRHHTSRRPPAVTGVPCPKCGRHKLYRVPVMRCQQRELQRKREQREIAREGK